MSHLSTAFYPLKRVGFRQQFFGKMKKTIEIFTIGFTKNRSRIFDNLTESKVKCVIDTRVNNASQLAGFAKKKI
ncbi:hypothetical protein CYANOKiyG1_15910 [Okeania sp. KiyG1]|nr:hypothetical protein CYANOKiyG1_15910 [Okeania sp. KiyG1]